jgi:hypothetical protein
MSSSSSNYEHYLPTTKINELGSNTKYFKVKDKGYPMTCLSRHSRYADVYLQPTRNFDARKGWVAITTTSRVFYLCERKFTNCTRGWVGLRASPDVHEKSRLKKFQTPKRQPLKGRCTNYMKCRHIYSLSRLTGLKPKVQL